MQNVTIDKQLCVGDQTILRTCTSDGGALLVQNGCCTQTSGNLAHVCGEPGQIALRVENGRVQLDPNEALSSNTSVGVSVSNATVQTNGKLVNITGTADQIAFAVTGGKTTLDPNSSSGGALEISNSATQTSGILVNITGSSSEVALQVSEGETRLDANASSADTLVLQNSVTQDSNSKMVHVIGQSNKMALQVDDGDVQLDNVNSGNAVLTGGSINNMPIGSSTASTGSFVSVNIDSNNIAGGGLTVTNTATQSSDELVSITGEMNQVALKVVEGNTELSGSTTVETLSATNGIDNTVIGGTTPSSGSFTTIHVDPNEDTGGAIMVRNTQSQSSGNAVTIDGQTNGQIGGKLLEIQGSVGQDALYLTKGNVIFEGEMTGDNRASSSGGFSSANASIMMRSGVTIDGTDYSGNNAHYAELHNNGQISGGLIVSGGVAVGGSLWQSPLSIATDDGQGNVTGGLLVGGGAVIDKNIIMVNVTEPQLNHPGSLGELRIVGDTMYLYTSSGWKKSVFSSY